ncbi:MAG: hypothetical protein ACHQF3_12820, partial [Alphaproteobacteria bacterium]
GNLVAVIATTPSGKTIQLYAEVELVERTLVLRQFAIYGVNAASGELGWTMLRKLAYAALEDFDVDRIRIEEARRTSGANPGHAVRSIEFRRRDD